MSKKVFKDILTSTSIICSLLMLTACNNNNSSSSITNNTNIITSSEEVVVAKNNNYATFANLVLCLLCRKRYSDGAVVAPHANEDDYAQRKV